MRSTILVILVSGLVLLALGCKKTEREHICYTAPSFGVYIETNDGGAALQNVYLYVVDTATGDTLDGGFIGNNFRFAKLKDGTQTCEYVINEAEKYFSNSAQAKSYYLIFTDKGNGNKTDTLSNFSWTTTKPKVGCYTFSKVSVTHNGVQVDPTASVLNILE